MDSFLGQILLVGFDFAPQNFMLCQGQILAVRDNPALFALLGWIYGGDGSTTFALPDLRGRIPVGFGRGKDLTPYNLGQMGGTEVNTLEPRNLPVVLNGVVHVQASTRDTDPSLPRASGLITPVNNIQPYLALNYIICTAGIFPTRQY